MALAVSLQHIALLTVELGDRAAMSAKAVTCCIRIFEVLEGTDILNADILDMLASTLMDDFASTSFAIVFVLFLVLDSSIFEVFFIGSVLLCEVINGPSPGAQPKLFILKYFPLGNLEWRRLP